jgi:RNA polymerase sigma-70 factor (ECF subfamily)
MGWMKSIMINTAIDRLRKDNFLPEIGHIDESMWIEDRSQSPDKNILYKELILQVKRLPPAYRAVFNLYVIDGYSHQEIAFQLQISTGTTKSNLSKARVLLQKYIQQNDMKEAYVKCK